MKGEDVSIMYKKPQDTRQPVSSSTSCPGGAASQRQEILQDTAKTDFPIMLGVGRRGARLEVGGQWKL